MRGLPVSQGNGAWWGRLLLVTVLGLCFPGCPAPKEALSPAAAAFKNDMRETIGKLSKVLVEPVCRDDAAACEKAIAAIYPEAPKDTLTFPFHVGVMNQKGILIYTIPPVKNIGDDYSQYKAVKDALKAQRIKNVRFFAPNGKELLLVLAPLMKKEEMVGLLVLRLDPGQVKKKWGISEKEFLALNLN